MKKIAISQSNYIPWKGYFDLIAQVDVFVLYDDMQYTRRDWRNRNQIKTQGGLSWLSIPVHVKGKYHQKINEVEVSDTGWAVSHWSKITQNYKDTPYFKDISKWLKPLYLEQNLVSLSEINRQLIEAICEYLGIKTQLIDSREFDLVDGKTERLVGICKDIGAAEYISGPAAKDYIEPDFFDDVDIKLSWVDYSNYPTHPQKWEGFEHSVSILDLLFNTGPDASKYMKYV